MREPRDNRVDNAKRDAARTQMPVTENSAEADAMARSVVRYAKPSRLRASIELAATVILLSAFWCLLFVAALRGEIVLYVFSLIASAVMLVRLFLVQHDCGHHAFFASSLANALAGRLISVLTITPYDHWRHCHALHHASSGDLSRRGVGDVDTLTVAEYLARSSVGRLRYRAYRHPLVMFAVGPIYLFFVQHRLPFGFWTAGWKPWLSTLLTNAAIAMMLWVLVATIGWRMVLAVYLPVVMMAAAMGVWLFYVQHQFEHTHWATHANWHARTASLLGSSYYDLAAPLAWITANIGIHHVHHLCSRVPFYRLRRVLDDFPALKTTGRVSFIQSMAGIRLALWDEADQRMVSFRQLKRNSHAQY